MRIAIDCADLDHQRIDGTRVYIENLLNYFGQLDNKNEFFLYHQRDFNPMLCPAQFPNYIDRKIPYRFWWTQTRLAFELKRDKPDVLWMPIQQLPYLNEKDKFKKAVTVHDLAFKIFPQYFPKKDRFKLNLFTDYAVKKADIVIAVSNSTKKDILRFYPKVNPDKITVVYHGINQNHEAGSMNHEYKSKFQIPNSQPKAGPPMADKFKTCPSGRRVINSIKTTHYSLLTTHYILYLGAIQPRKNLETLVKAFEIFKKEKIPPSPPFPREGIKGDLKLVLAGEPAWMAEDVMRKIKNSSFSQDIIMAGKVSFEEARRLYENATVFVFPSLYEGFGMPVLEAWAGGTPVIVADNSSLSEVGGDAVEKFDGKNADELANKIRLLLEDKNRRIELMEKGKERLKMFSWEKCAKETLGVLKSW